MSGTSGYWRRPGTPETTSLTPQVFQSGVHVAAQADAAPNVADIMLLEDGSRIESGKVIWYAHGLTVGAYYYTSQTTPGAYTSVAPTTGLFQRLFYVEDADTIHVDVEPATLLGSSKSGTGWYVAGTTNDAYDDKTGSLNRIGFVGLGVSSGFVPNSRLDTQESFGAGITVSATAVTLTAAHHTVVLTGASLTQALPTPVARRIYNIKNAHASTNLTVSGHIDNTPSTTRVIPASQARAFHSDGTTWWVI